MSLGFKRIFTEVINVLLRQLWSSRVEMVLEVQECTDCEEQGGSFPFYASPGTHAGEEIQGIRGAHESLPWFLQAEEWH